MKRVKKLLALAITLAMGLSLSTTAYATDATVSEDESIICETFAISADDEDIMLMSSRDYVVKSGSLSDGEKVSGSFTVSQNERLTWELGVVGSVHLKITIRKGLVTGTLYDANVTNDVISMISGDVVEGMKVSYTLTSNGRTDKYGLIIGGTN